MASLEWMSVKEIQRRCAIIAKDAEHLRRTIPVDNAHNSIVRIPDIALSIGLPPGVLGLRLSRGEFDEAHIKDLSRFFYGWDAGMLIKARVGNEWKIMSRHPGHYQGHTPLAQMAAPQGAAPARPPLTLTIDRSTLGLKVGK